MHFVKKIRLNCFGNKNCNYYSLLVFIEFYFQNKVYEKMCRVLDLPFFNKMENHNCFY